MARVRRWAGDGEKALSRAVLARDLELAFRSLVKSGREFVPRARARERFGAEVRVRDRALLAETVKRAEVLYSVLRRVNESAPEHRHAVEANPGGFVVRLCDRFHLIAKRLAVGATGKTSRGALIVRNEYDVQRIFHALLQLEFDEVRREEWTPSYAGGAARVDFHIPRHGIVVETKMTRKGLDDKRVGEELLIDCAKYRQRPDFSTLYCFIYDPDDRLKNPRGLERDLMNMSTRRLSVAAIIRPWGT